MGRNKLKIFYISAGRSDYGLIKNGIIQFQKIKKIKCYPIILGAHNLKKFGTTKSEIIKDKIKNIIPLKIKYLNNNEDNTIFYFEQILSKFNKLVSKYKPKICIITGDRYEMMAISLVCLNQDVPIVHFCGGSITRGSLDDKYRNVISSFSKLHFVETAKHRKQLIKNGIKRNKIFVSGAPALENLSKIKFLKKSTFFNKFNFDLKKKIIIFTFHPETNLDLNRNLKNLEISVSFLKKLDQKKYNIVISYPNADFGFEQIINVYKKINNRNIFIFKNFGVFNYYNLLNHASIMIGNSSSGIIESASFKLPVLNLGDRQKGRFRGINVVNASFSYSNINKKFKYLINNSFKEKISRTKNIYGVKFNAKKYCKIIINYFKSGKSS